MAKVGSESDVGFGEILARLSSGGAGEIVDCLDELKDPEYAVPMTGYLATRFGRDPKKTRVLIRAAGDTPYRPLHDLLASRLLDRSGSKYRYELLDALGKTGRRDYAGLLLPFLADKYGFDIQSTAIASLGLLGSPLAIAPLVKIMANKEGRLRSLAIDALRNLLSTQMNPESIEMILMPYPPEFLESFRSQFGIVVRPKPSQVKGPRGIKPLGNRPRRDRKPEA